MAIIERLKFGTTQSSVHSSPNGRMSLILRQCNLTQPIHSLYVTHRSETHKIAATAARRFSTVWRHVGSDFTAITENLRHTKYFK